MPDQQKDSTPEMMDTPDGAVPYPGGDSIPVRFTNPHLRKFEAEIARGAAAAEAIRAKIEASRPEIRLTNSDLEPALDRAMSEDLGSSASAVYVVLEQLCEVAAVQGLVPVRIARAIAHLAEGCAELVQAEAEQAAEEERLAEGEVSHG